MTACRALFYDVRVCHLVAKPHKHSAKLVEALGEHWRHAAETGGWVALALIHSDHRDPRLLVALRWVLARSCDVVVRTGDRGFGVIFPHTKFRGALRVMERFVAVVGALEQTESASPTTVEVGISAYPAAGDNSMYLLLDDAQDALQHAKGLPNQPKARK